METGKEDYKLTYYLKQQTPMIHFQYDEPGACIRASELKPKLDKFLMDNYPKERVEKWKLEGQNALDYKVRIIPKGAPSIISETAERDIQLHSLNKGDKEKKAEITSQYKGIHAMYFGNMVDRKDSNYNKKVKESYKETVFYDKPVKVEIICFNDDLRQALDKSAMKEFFSITNFGTRQSKGFGGFSIADQTGEGTYEILKDKKYSFFYFTVPSGCDTYDKKMTMAAAVYNTIKGGFNFTEPGKVYKNEDETPYIKGYIQRQFFDDNGKPTTGSEKSGIKATVLPISEKKKKLLKEEDEYKKYDKNEFSRALFGLADHYDYIKVRIGKVLVLDKNEQIKRFKSPITIKIVDDYVFLIITDTFNLIEGKEFILKKDEDGNNQKEQEDPDPTGEPITISVPEKFDVKAFVPNFIKYFNKVKIRFKVIGKGYQKAEKINDLTGVYKGEEVK